MIGGCLLKHVYYKDAAVGTLKDDQLINLQTGTLLHASRETAVRKYEKELKALIKEQFGEEPIAIYQEMRITDPDTGVTGHPDIIIEYENHFDIIDDKYVKMYKYKKTFARAKRDRDPKNLDNYKMQIIQYALIFEKMSGKKMRHAIIMLGKKDDLFQREVPVYKSEWEDAIKKYWKDLEELDQATKILGVMPGVTYGVPFHSWECNYCRYKAHCFPNEPADDVPF